MSIQTAKSLAEKDFGKNNVKLLEKKGIVFIGVAALPQDKSEKKLTGRNYVVMKNGREWTYWDKAIRMMLKSY